MEPTIEVEGVLPPFFAMGPSSASARKFEILHAIVKAYIETGEPVASRSVARARRDNLSAASVRNVMADLCDEGYLAQPHTSAGRIPTEKAFRSYINSLLATNRVLTAELSRVRNELGRMDTIEGRMERSSHILTEMTHSVGIAAAIPTASQHLDQIELLSLGDRRVLMIVVTKDRTGRSGSGSSAWMSGSRKRNSSPSGTTSTITSAAGSSARCRPS